MKRVLQTALVVTMVVTISTGSAVADGDFVPPPELADGWYARIETSMGQIIALLHPEHAPQAVAHFAALADGRLEWHDPVTGQAQKAPYYDGIEVHFAMAGRLFEAGYRPGADSAPELWVPLEGAAGKPFGRGGRLGMAAKRPGISGVVFFITASPDRKLDRTYPCFGTVVSELETVYRITEVKTRKGGRPIEPVTIEKIRIFAVGNPAPLPEPVPFFPVRRRLQDN